MKKFLFLAASAALVLASCAKNEVLVNPDQQEAIGFGTYVGQSPVTKANEQGVDVLSTYGFGVYANYGGITFGKNLMDNTKIDYNDAVCTYNKDEDTKYWSTTTNDNYAFYAYAPYTAGISMSDGKITIESDDNTDYLVATPITGTKATILNGDNDIDLVFRHAKSKLTVNITHSEANGATFTLTGWSIAGFHSKGDLDLNFNGTTATWTNLTGDARTIQSSVTGDSFLVIPDNYTALTLTVNYTLTQGSLEYENQVLTKTIELDLDGTTAYDLNITAGLNSIEFAATVNDNWEDGGSLSREL